jgi:hypothetical protein
VTELVSRLGMIKLLDAAIGPIKTRHRGLSGGQLLVGLATARLAGEEFVVGLDRQRGDAAGQVLAPVPGLSSPPRPGWRAGSPTAVAGGGDRDRRGASSDACRGASGAGGGAG